MAVTGYGTEYYGRFASRDGLAYQVHILKAAYAGSSSEVTLQEDPCRISWGRRGVGRYEPILASFAQSRNWKIAGTELENMIGASPGTYLMEVLSGADHATIDAGSGDRVWLGRVLTDAYQDSTMDDPSTMEVSAVDGLGTLKNVPYTDVGSSEAPFAGRDSLINIIFNCLLKLDYALPVAVAAEWFPDAASDTLRDPLAHLEVDQDIFYDDDGRALSCYDVLRQILLAFGCQLWQRAGRWEIVQPHLLDGTNYTMYLYTSGGAANGSEYRYDTWSPDPVPSSIPANALDVDALIEARTSSRRSGSRSFRQARRSSTVDYNHGPVPSLIEYGDFALETGFVSRPGVVTDGLDADDYWTLTNGTTANAAIVDTVARFYADRPGRTIGRGSGPRRYTARLDHKLELEAFAHGTTTVPSEVVEAIVDDGPSAEQTGAAVAIGDKIAFVGEFEIPYNAGDGDGLYTPYFEVLISGTSYYLKRDGTWGTSATIYDRVQPVYDQGSTWGSGIALDTPATVEIVSAAAPAAGDILVRLWGTSDVDGASVDPDSVLWDNVAVLLVDDNGDVLTGARYEAHVASTEEAMEPVEVIIGQGPKTNVPNRLTWYESPTRSEAVAFSVPGGTDQALGSLLAETLIRAHIAPLETRHETYRLLGAEMGQPILVGTKYCAPVYLQKDLYQADDAGEWVEVRADADTLTTAQVATDAAALPVPHLGTSSVVQSSGGGSTYLPPPYFAFNPAADLMEYGDGDTVSSPFNVGIGTMQLDSQYNPTTHYDLKAYNPTFKELWLSTPGQDRGIRIETGFGANHTLSRATLAFRYKCEATGKRNLFAWFGGTARVEVDFDTDDTSPRTWWVDFKDDGGNTQSWTDQTTSEIPLESTCVCTISPTAFRLYFDGVLEYEWTPTTLTDGLWSDNIIFHRVQTGFSSSAGTDQYLGAVELYDVEHDADWALAFHERFYPS